jgi:hypothetical protein
MALRGLFRLALRRIAAMKRMKEVARTSLRRASRDSGQNYGEFAADIVAEAAELEQEAQYIVESAYYDALEVMFGMCANAGQITVFEEYIIDAFAKQLAESNIENGWDDVDIGDYMTFMGEIVAEGNAIMEEAFDEAQDNLFELYELLALIGQSE